MVPGGWGAEVAVSPLQLLSSAPSSSHCYSAPGRVLHGLQSFRINLVRHGLFMGLSVDICSGAWSTSSPSFFTDLSVCKVVSHTIFSHSSLPTAAQFMVFLPFLKYTFPEALPSWLRGSAMPYAGSAGTNCVWPRAAPASSPRDPVQRPTPSAICW